MKFKRVALCVTISWFFSLMVFTLFLSRVEAGPVFEELIKRDQTLQVTFRETERASKLAHNVIITSAPTFVCSLLLAGKIIVKHMSAVTTPELAAWAKTDAVATIATFYSSYLLVSGWAWLHRRIAGADQYQQAIETHIMANGLNAAIAGKDWQSPIGFLKNLPTSVSSRLRIAADRAGNQGTSWDRRRATSLAYLKMWEEQTDPATLSDRPYTAFVEWLDNRLTKDGIEPINPL